MNQYLSSFFPQFQKKDDASNEAQAGDDDKMTLPDVLPILPLRGVVVYPDTAVPLTVGQPRSIKLVDDVVAGDKLVGLVAALDPELETPGPKELYRIGTVATVHRLLRAPDGTVRLLVQGMERFKLGDFVEEEPYLKAHIIRSPEDEEKNIETDALARNARDQFQAITQMIPSFPEELASSILSIEDPLQTVYTIANFQRIDLKDAQEILEIDSVYDKLKKLIGLLVREAEVLQIGQKIQNEARGEIEKVQRDYFLREQMKAIQRELGERDEQSEEIDEFRKKIDEAKMPEEADKQARRELDRLSRLPSAAAEYGVIRTYLDTMVALPWSVDTKDNLDIAHARKVLNQDHYGLEDVKDRILEFLAIRKLRLDRADDKKEETTDFIRREREGVILCFVGPPGVGKTSLGQSIARAMGRKFI
ncbi:MAG: LON peptidase substrate-binding domain-containing protein, partial [Anaerolineales bacterium]|nr:LON peptidase substrate-binding domain-containing protein [Anaerolineales bacterium]